METSDQFPPGAITDSRQSPREPRWNGHQNFLISALGELVDHNLFGSRRR